MDPRALSLRLRWLGRREMSRLGWSGLAGIALLVFALGIALSALWPARHEVASLRAEFAELRTKLRATGGPGGAHASPTKQAQLETFYAFFPPAETLPDWVGQVHNAAARSGLALEKGEYQLQRPPGSRLARYQIQLPVKGTYPQLRGFIATVLQKVPAAAIEDVAVKRETIGAPVLEARVRISLYLGGGS
ncbi:MAG: hypothetical protein U1F52_01960 [Burkholderiales bacterium]